MRSNRRDDFQVGTGHSRYAGLQLVEGALSLSAHLLARDPTLLAGQLVGRGHSEDVMAVAVTPDGKRPVSASADRTLKLWDLERGEGICTLEGHSNYVWAVAVTPDGKRAVSASDDNTLKLWDLERFRSCRLQLCGP